MLELSSHPIFLRRHSDRVQTGRPADAELLCLTLRGDAAGDIFFLMTDVLSLPYACNVSHDTWWACRQRTALGHDQVYTQLVLEVDGTHVCKDDDLLYGEGCLTYADCNPDQTPPPNTTFRCDCIKSHQSDDTALALAAPAPPAAGGGCDLDKGSSQCRHISHRNLSNMPNMRACVDCFTAATGCSVGAVWDRCAMLSKQSCSVFGVEPIDARYCAGLQNLGAGRNGFPPPEKNELVLSIEMGCTDTVPFQSRLNTPF